jgi:hypothetical protein
MVLKLVSIGGCVTVGILVCQTCETIVEHTNNEKVSKLYTTCKDCNKK